MIIRAKAPLRLGLAGGGTDLSPFCDLYTGYVLNATIDMHAYCVIEETTDGIISFNAADRGEQFTIAEQNSLAFDGVLDLHKGVYNRIRRDYNGGAPLSFRMTTYSDAPAGSGLGTSSTLVVAMIKAFTEWLNLPLGEYETANLAYVIERKDVGLAGGKQDQYAATFGGFNFIEFYSNEKVLVNPLRIREWIIDELEASMILYYSGVSRSSAEIIKHQISNTISKEPQAMESLHQIKKDAMAIKESVLKGDFAEFAHVLNNTWESKKKTAGGITNDLIEKIYLTAIGAGAHAGKISGAGGGGYMFFVVDPVRKADVSRALLGLGGQIVPFHFVATGTKAWTI